jgi:hypothetical protein
MNAAVVTQSAAGANLANSLTLGYRRLGVAQNTVPEGGVTAKLVRGRVPGGDPILDVVAEIGAVYSLRANIVSLKTADRMTGTVLNLRA